MSANSETELPDLEGSVDARLKQMASYDSSATQLSASWLHRQLSASLAAWAALETKADIATESREDY